MTNRNSLFVQSHALYFPFIKKTIPKRHAWRHLLPVKKYHMYVRWNLAPIIVNQLRLLQSMRLIECKTKEWVWYAREGLQNTLSYGKKYTVAPAVTAIFRQRPLAMSGQFQSCFHYILTHLTCHLSNAVSGQCF